MRALVLAAVALVLAPQLAARDDPRSATVARGLAALSDPELARGDYVEHCAGCHGVQGISAPAKLPELRGRVGYMMCTADTRAYLLRLPNIAKSRISDNQQLADMLNFMVFGLGGDSVIPGTQPFTAQEVEYERRFALTSASLVAERKRHVETAIRKCGAPEAFRDFYRTRG
ncbi:MAG: cytochrome C [Novosphingobium sp. 17-62-19]|uniref:c-type cytochrome n=1 Tax=Novosphingobium sp. 17-62-19 TaxID=1970406 RepID=UPI000BD87788|nr:cytochrome C [Novosphingobium sp. 17-62-19]OYX91887.1 MAG: cytochrome C [Novosphingobium sp. 35-62-5]OZA21282.1 MAG: cytochrome C [Novosphingobium sp. 17-62-19]HQS98174.1 cytochrome C [Novosphingobium sp.]